MTEKKKSSGQISRVHTIRTIWFCFIMMLACCSAAMAGIKNISIEASGGLNLSQVESSDDYKYFNTMDMASRSLRKGMNLGLGLGYSFNENFGIVTGIAYENKGNRAQMKQEYTDFTGLHSEKLEIEWNLDYLTFPVQGEIGIPIKPGRISIRLGVGVGYLLSNKGSAAINDKPLQAFFDSLYLAGEFTPAEYSGISQEMPLFARPPVNKLDIGFLGGLAYEYRIGIHGIFAESDIFYGFKEIQKEATLQGTDYFGMPVAYKLAGTVTNFSGSVKLGYRYYFAGK